jgi:hypothetical protein
VSALDRMTEDASSAGIYGGRPEDYAAALKKARTERAPFELPPHDHQREANDTGNIGRAGRRLGGCWPRSAAPGAFQPPLLFFAQLADRALCRIPTTWLAVSILSRMAGSKLRTR